MSNMFLKLNEEKTVVKIFNPRILKYSNESFPLKFLSFNPVESIKTLGVSINGKLQLHNFIANKVRICNMHLRNLYNIRKSLDESTRILLVTNLILSTIDYCNVLLLGLPEKSLNPLKLIINRAIRFIYNLKYKDHVTFYYKKLHILPIRQRIRFKACLIAFKILHNYIPGYLKVDFETHVHNFSMIQREGPGRDPLMFTPNSNDIKGVRLTTKIQKEWNLLSFETRSSPTITVFKTKLKTELFRNFFLS